MTAMSALNRIMIYVAALVLFVFCTAPFFLSLVGSIVPQRALLALPLVEGGVQG